MTQFESQRDGHRRIRNDPDYDDWEYGTEPLPGEPWPQPPEPGSPGPELLLEMLECRYDRT